MHGPSGPMPNLAPNTSMACGVIECGRLGRLPGGAAAAFLHEAATNCCDGQKICSPSNAVHLGTLKRGCIRTLYVAVSRPVPELPKFRPCGFVNGTASGRMYRQHATIGSGQAADMN